MHSKLSTLLVNAGVAPILSCAERGFLYTHTPESSALETFNVTCQCRSPIDFLCTFTALTVQFRMAGVCGALVPIMYTEMLLYRVTTTEIIPSVVTTQQVTSGIVRCSQSVTEKEQALRLLQVVTDNHS